ncbi:MAG: c-type cytochrome [Opitutales bacterium]
MMRYFFMFWALAVICTFLLLGWRGQTFDEPPLYLFPDMDIQAKYHPQMSNDFYEDARNDRQPVAGTVARGHLFELDEIFTDGYEYPVAQNEPLYTGKGADGEFVDRFPVEVDETLLQLGREKYDIFCTVCHGPTGAGNGVVASDGSDYAMTRGYFGNVANLTSQTYIDYSEGKLWDRITNGWNTMYPYRDKLTPYERWAVVAYVRALQLAANGTLEDVPENQRNQL